MVPSGVQCPVCSAQYPDPLPGKLTPEPHVGRCYPLLVGAKTCAPQPTQCSSPSPNRGRRPAKSAGPGLQAQRRTEPEQAGRPAQADFAGPRSNRGRRPARAAVNPLYIRGEPSPTVCARPTSGPPTTSAPAESCQPCPTRAGCAPPNTPLSLYLAAGDRQPGSEREARNERGMPHGPTRGPEAEAVACVRRGGLKEATRRIEPSHVRPTRHLHPHPPKHIGS